MVKAPRRKTPHGWQTPFDGKGLRRQGVNCMTVTSKHPLFSQSLESWYGWVGCCIKGECRSGDVAYMWSVGMKEKTLQRQVALKPKAIR
jgi:hypothetical protein